MYFLLVWYYSQLIFNREFLNLGAKMRGPCCLCLLLISSIWVMSDAVEKVSENEESDAKYNAEWLAFEKKFGKPGKLIRRFLFI